MISNPEQILPLLENGDVKLATKTTFFGGNQDSIVILDQFHDVVTMITHEIKCVIIGENIFFNLSEEDLQIVLVHELAHVLLDTGNIRNVNEEIICDSLAVDCFGKKKVLNTMRQLENCLEHHHRIKNLRGKYFPNDIIAMVKNRIPYLKKEIRNIKKSIYNGRN